MVWKNPEGYGEGAGTFKCKIFHEQRKMIERQFQKMLRVPLTFGPNTKFVPLWGRVQLGLKLKESPSWTIKRLLASILTVNMVGVSIRRRNRRPS
jgi:hypothetical protein